MIVVPVLASGIAVKKLVHTKLSLIVSDLKPARPINFHLLISVQVTYFVACVLKSDKTFHLLKRNMAITNTNKQTHPFPLYSPSPFPLRTPPPPKMEDASGKAKGKRTPHGTKRAFGFFVVAAALALLYYLNVVLPADALVGGGGRGTRLGGAGASSKGPLAPLARDLTAAEVQAIIDQGPPSGVGSPDKVPRAPNTAICNESVLEGVMSVARQQSARATAMYEDERKRRERQDVELDACKIRLERLEAELHELKGTKPELPKA